MHIFFDEQSLFVLFLVHWVEFAFLLYFIYVNGFYTILLFLTVIPFYKRYAEAKAESETQMVSAEAVPPLTVVIPVFNERHMAISAILSLLRVKYRAIELVIVNDGSTDETLELMINKFHMIEAPVITRPIIKCANVKRCYRSAEYPNLLVVDKERAGRPDALNAGINASSAPYILILDCDTTLESGACQKMMMRALSQPDLAAIGGTLRVANGCVIEQGKVVEVRLPKSYFASMQVIDYIRSFTFGRVGWSLIGGQYNVSGAFGLFKKQALYDVGGFHPSYAEDLDLTIRLQRGQKRGLHKLDFLPDATAWTEVPFTYRDLRKQRARWHAGLFEALWFNKRALFNPKYGAFGFVHLPFLIIGEFLSPLMEILGYCYILIAAILGMLNMTFLGLFLALSWGTSLLLSLYAFVIEQSSSRKYGRVGDMFKCLGLVFLELFGYRQLYLLWKLEGFLKFFKRTGGVYGSVPRAAHKKQ